MEAERGVGGATGAGWGRATDTHAHSGEKLSTPSPSYSHTLCTHTHTCILTPAPVCSYTLTPAHMEHMCPVPAQSPLGQPFSSVECRWVCPSLQQPAEPSKHSHESFHSGVENISVLTWVSTGPACDCMLPSLPPCFLYHKHRCVFKRGIMSMYRKQGDVGGCDQFLVCYLPISKSMLEVFQKEVTFRQEELSRSMCS